MSILIACVLMILVFGDPARVRRVLYPLLGLWIVMLSLAHAASIGTTYLVLAVCMNGLIVLCCIVANAVRVLYLHRRKTRRGGDDE